MLTVLVSFYLGFGDPQIRHTVKLCTVCNGPSDAWAACVTALNGPRGSLNALTI